MKDTRLINLYGGPGISKSTTASGVFSLLKLQGVDCELVTEFAKDLTWEERYNTLKNQEYIFGKQYHRLWRLNGKVDVIITDSPLLFGLVYGTDKTSDNFKKLIIEKYDEFYNLNYLLNRVKPYNPNGRNQTEEQAKEIDIIVEDVLTKYSGHYSIIKGNYNAINIITSDVLIELQKKKYFFIKPIRDE